jgi:hypothetical protein
VDDTWEMFVGGTNVGQPPYRYLKDSRRSHEKSEESKKRVCAQELLGKDVPENGLSYVQSVKKDRAECVLKECVGR